MNPTGSKQPQEKDAYTSLGSSFLCGGRKQVDSKTETGLEVECFTWEQAAADLIRLTFLHLSDAYFCLNFLLYALLSIPVLWDGLLPK